MACVSSRAWQSIAVALVIVLLSGCERASSHAVAAHAAQPSAARSPAAMTTVASTNLPSATLTPEMQEAVRMRDALDAGDMRTALSLARGLVDSKEQKVLLQVVETMEWVGKAALPELTELANNGDEVVAEAALQAWDRVVDGIEDENLRLAVVTKTARSLTRENLIDAVFLKLVDCDRIAAISALAGFIETSGGMPANRCAREMFAHIAQEEWVSRLRAEQILQGLRNNKETGT